MVRSGNSPIAYNVGSPIAYNVNSPLAYNQVKGPDSADHQKLEELDANPAIPATYQNFYQYGHNNRHDQMYGSGGMRS
jgi:hypothetical protein